MSFKKILTWLSIFGSIASLMGLIYIFFPLRDNNIKLNLIVSSCDNLTIFNNIREPEIKAQFEYKGNKISKLWRLNVVLKNVSGKTIIGKGQLKNIMYDKLYFFIKDGYQIIDKKLLKSNLAHTLSIRSNDTIQLSFGQWRSGESIEYSFYITTNLTKNPGIEMFYQPIDRQIIDGDIVFLRELQTNEQEFITNKLGKPTKKVSYVLFITMSIITLIIFIIIIISNPTGFILRKQWRKKYLTTYNETLRIKYKDNLNYLNQVLDKPENYVGWPSFNGKKYPKSWGLDFEINKIFNLITISLLFIAMSFVQSIVIIDLIQLFP